MFSLLFKRRPQEHTDTQWYSATIRHFRRHNTHHSFASLNHFKIALDTQDLTRNISKHCIICVSTTVWYHWWRTRTNDIIIELLVARTVHPNDVDMTHSESGDRLPPERAKAEQSLQNERDTSSQRPYIWRRRPMPPEWARPTTSTRHRRSRQPPPEITYSVNEKLFTRNEICHFEVEQIYKTISICVVSH